MRTTLDLPQNLVEEGMKITGSRTKSQLIKFALEKLIAGEKRRRLLTYQGKIDLDIDLDELRERK
ncbi:MAG: type II toxin-antitoxin system VapB family antitoxin [Cytophagales bacterium]|nr:type II toxin-antitoxin system VapB family antitoxin [Cytophagales bacterium]